MSSMINNAQNLGNEENPTTPLMRDSDKKVRASLATPELEEPDVEVITKSTKVNDPNNGSAPNSRNDNTAGVPNSPSPNNTSNVNTTNETKPEQNPRNIMNEQDGSHRKHSEAFPHFPTEADFALQHHRHDVDLANSILEELPDLNVYQHKKTLAQGMMDLALFSANANQLRYVLDSYDRHPYYYPSLIFIIISLVLQVAIGVLLIWNATYNVKDEKEVCRANRINNYTVVGIFLVTVVNVFVSSFGVADPPTTLPISPVGNTT